MNNGFTLDFNGSFYKIDHPDDLFAVYDDFIYNYMDGTIEIDAKDLSTIFLIVDRYKELFNAVIENGINYIDYIDLEEMALEILL